MRMPHETISMSRLIYVTNTSLDGYIEDETGAHNWITANQVHTFATELLRPVGTYLYGRRLYETMAYWDAPVEGYPPEHRDFARVWQKPEKIVFSRTLTGATTRNTRRAGLRHCAHSEAQTGIGARHQHRRRRACGACTRSRSRRRMSPVTPSGDPGGGKPAFRPALRRNLELLETHRVGTGVIHVHYRIRRGTP